MMASLHNAYTQMFPPVPTFTEAQLPLQTGKTFMVTGGSDGIGFELVKILYSKGAKVYIASRSQDKADASMKTISSTPTSTPGEVKFIHLDLADLESVRSAAEAFGKQEEKLDVLWNNAAVGVRALPDGSKTKQGHEHIVGTNCLGPFVLTQLLLPKLKAAVKRAPKNSVRVIWTSSIMIDFAAPKGGIDIAAFDSTPPDQVTGYTISKAGHWLLASEFARRVNEDGIVSITQNPGNLKTSLTDAMPSVVKILVRPIQYPPRMGAYTSLFAGLSPEITVEDGGRYIIPFGRWHGYPRKDITDGFKSKEDGGTGVAKDFWDWCEERGKDFI